MTTVLAFIAGGTGLTCIHGRSKRVKVYSPPVVVYVLCCLVKCLEFEECSIALSLKYLVMMMVMMVMVLLVNFSKFVYSPW